jgi:hypothetical protein
MEKVNIHVLLSDALVNGMGNTGDQAAIITRLFIDGLFVDEYGEMKFSSIDGNDGLEYHVSFDGHDGIGATPALALKNLLQEVVNGLYFAENGRP